MQAKTPVLLMILKVTCRLLDVDVCDICVKICKCSTCSDSNDET